MSNRYRRKEFLGSPVGERKTTWKNYPGFSSSSYYSYIPTGLVSECHDQLNAGPPYKSGGNLVIKHDEYHSDIFPYDRGRYVGYGHEHSFSGNGLIFPPPASFPEIEEDPYYLWAQGSTGMARAKPDIAQAGLSQILVEARKLPQLFDRVGTLGREFGWDTTKREVVTLHDTFLNMKKHLNQLRRDNGKSVRRRITLRDEKKVDVLSSEEGIYTSPPDGLGSERQTRIHTREFTHKVWYVGKFRYFLPEEFLNPAWEPLLEARIAGLSVNPEIAWDLTPFSWLADWFGNMGDIVSNISSFVQDNLVQEYGYVMSTQSVKSKYDVRFLDVNAVGKKYWRYTSAYRKRTLKMRVYGYPYSFGPTPGSLTNRQISILGALGLQLTGGGSRG